MASTEEVKPEVQEKLEEAAPSSEKPIVNQSPALAKASSCDVPDSHASSQGSASTLDNKRSTFNGSLKKHTPVFFPKSRLSESNSSLNDDIKKSVKDMWSDVRSVFRRVSSKKDVGKISPEKNDTPKESSKQVEGKEPVEKTEVVTADKNSGSDSLSKNPDPTPDDTKEKTSTEVIVLESGSTVEITEETASNNEVLHDDAQEVKDHEKVNDKEASNENETETESQVNNEN